jgi:RND family efflux transporter MFP subunit
MRLVWLGLVLGTIAGGCSRRSDAASEHPPGGMPPIPVEITEIQPVKLRESSEYISTLRSRRSVRVQPQVEGWITDIEAQSGDKVKPGAPLMRIDARRQVAAVKGQEANRAARLGDRAYWRQQVRRLELLYKGGGTSKQELEQARSSLTSAEAAVAAQDQQVRAASVELRFYRVSAPEAGTVGDVPVRVGDLATTQTLLTTIDHNEVLEAYVNVPVERAGGLRLGMPVEILSQSGAPPIEARVDFIAPQVSQDQTILVKSWIENESGRLRNAQLVRARLTWGERMGPAVPVVAVQMNNGQTFVWVAQPGPDGALVANQRAIQVGPIVGQTHPVLRGLSAGDKVIVAGQQKLRPGARVVQMPPQQKGKGG